METRGITKIQKIQLIELGDQLSEKEKIENKSFIYDLGKGVVDGMMPFTKSENMGDGCRKG